MGYETRHELEVVEGDQSLISELISENEDASYALDENGECEGPCKWYDHERDLREFSKKHPEALFRLNGEGE